MNSNVQLTADEPLSRFINYLGNLSNEISRKVKSTLTDNGYLKVFSLALVAFPLVLPVGTVANATDVTEIDTEIINLELTSFTDEIISVERAKISLPKVKKSEPQPVSLPVVTYVNVGKYLPEPDAAGKRVWVKKAATAYGIDWKILEAVWQVESGKSWHRGVRSWAGATGPCQFMPGTWRGYATDGNGDGIKDVTYAPDCLFGAAKLLASNGLAQGMTTQALLRYNHSMAYVNKVLSIARTY